MNLVTSLEAIAHAQLTTPLRVKRSTRGPCLTKNSTAIMSTGTRSKRSAVQEAGTPAKMAKISNHVGEVDGKPFSTPAPPSKAKGKGIKIHSGQHRMMPSLTLKIIYKFAWSAQACGRVGKLRVFSSFCNLCKSRGFRHFGLKIANFI